MRCFDEGRDLDEAACGPVGSTIEVDGVVSDCREYRWANNVDESRERVVNCLLLSIDLAEICRLVESRLGDR